MPSLRTFTSRMKICASRRSSTRVIVLMRLTLFAASFRSSATSSGSDTRLRKYSFVMSFSTKLKIGSSMAAPEMFLS